MIAFFDQPTHSATPLIAASLCFTWIIEEKNGYQALVDNLISVFDDDSMLLLDVGTHAITDPPYRLDSLAKFA